MTKARPLSPHLTIYNPQISSVLSIMHRITGFYLYVGLLVLSWVIIFSTFDQSVFAVYFLDFSVFVFSSIIGKLLLFAWFFSMNYHAANGVRHLFWDAGYGFGIKSVIYSGLFTLSFAVVMTLITWFFVFSLIFNYV